MDVLFIIGGDEENRTPVRKMFAVNFSERSCYFEIPPAQRLTTGYAFR